MKLLKVDMEEKISFSQYGPVSNCVQVNSAVNDVKNAIYELSFYFWDYLLTMADF